MDAFFIVLLLAIVLFPILWWMFSERSGAGRETEMTIPVPRSDQRSNDEDDRSYARSERTDNGRAGTTTRTASEESRTTWGQESRTSATPRQSPTAEQALGASVWDTEGHAGATGESLQAGQRATARAGSADAAADTGGEPGRPEPGRRPGTAQEYRRMVRAQIHSRSRLREAMLVRAILGTPKALQPPDESDLPGR